MRRKSPPSPGLSCAICGRYSRRNGTPPTPWAGRMMTWSRPWRWSRSGCWPSGPGRNHFPPMTPSTIPTAAQHFPPGERLHPRRFRFGDPEQLNTKKERKRFPWGRWPFLFCFIKRTLVLIVRQARAFSFSRVLPENFSRVVTATRKKTEILSTKKGQFGFAGEILRAEMVPAVQQPPRPGVQVGRSSAPDGLPAASPPRPGTAFLILSGAGQAQPRQESRFRFSLRRSTQAASSPATSPRGPETAFTVFSDEK